MLHLLASVSFIYADDLYTDYIYIYSNCIVILMFKKDFKKHLKTYKIITEKKKIILPRFLIITIVTISILT